MVERFRKIREIGKGGFGKVYEALDLHTGETIALKELFGNYVSFSQCMELTEVKALQQIHHPNIVSLKELVYKNQ